MLKYLLLHSAGEDVREIFNSLPETKQDRTLLELVMLSKLTFNHHRNTLNIRYSVVAQSKKLNPLTVISHV